MKHHSHKAVQHFPVQLNDASRCMLVYRCDTIRYNEMMDVCDVEQLNINVPNKD